MGKLLLYGACWLICVYICYMYHQTLEAILYAFVLCTLLCTAAFFYGFYRFYISCRACRLLHTELEAGLERFPVCRSELEKEYQTIIREAYALCQSLREQNRKEFEELLDYYTLWVHQIKTPISAMRLMLQKDMSDEGELLKLELFRIEQYVEMVLSYLRLSDDASDYVIRRIDLDDVVREALHKYSSSFIQKKLTLEYHPCHLEILSDEKWLSFVIEQLLGNAIKYTAQGGIHIYLEKECLFIADDGIGIAPEDLPRIFEKGYTGFNGRADKHASGLGLYLCKRVMKNLNHGIRAESQVGKGTVMILDFSREARWIA